MLNWLQTTGGRPLRHTGGAADESSQAGQKDVPSLGGLVEKPPGFSRLRDIGKGDTNKENTPPVSPVNAMRGGGGGEKMVHWLPIQVRSAATRQEFRTSSPRVTLSSAHATSARSAAAALQRSFRAWRRFRGTTCARGDSS